jgi:GT2 family glycosyltransferase
MAIKLMELELLEKLMPIPIKQKYDTYRILVRYNKKPIGWMEVKDTNSPHISTEQLHHAIKKYLDWSIVQEAMVGCLDFRTNNAFSDKGISVIVCTRNRTKNLASCLEALTALQYELFEIIIIDNAPDNDDTYNLVQNFPVRYVREERPGLDWARNRGIEEAKYSVVAFTDDDALVDRFWLQATAKNFVNPEVMAVTGYVAPAELETPAQYLFEFGYGGMGHGFHRRIIKRETLTDRQIAWASNFGVGANMAFRRSVFEKIGLFDTALDVGTPSGGGGDVEMFHRLVAKGYELVYEPGMLVWHTHRQQITALRKQIVDNGRSFGCYLITCYKKRSIKRMAIVRFVVVDWLLKWNLRNLVTSKKIPKYLSLLEMYGMLSSPFAYRRSQIKAKEVADSHRKQKQPVVKPAFL